MTDTLHSTPASPSNSADKDTLEIVRDCRDVLEYLSVSLSNTDEVGGRATFGLHIILQNLYNSTQRIIENLENRDR